MVRETTLSPILYNALLASRRRVSAKEPARKGAGPESPTLARNRWEKPLFRAFWRPARLQLQVAVDEIVLLFAGTYRKMLLADFGADVVKVERPAPGDETRS